MGAHDRDLSPRFLRLARWALLANLGVIVWGAFVRATGSGAGCGSHWPLCNGEVVPRDPTIATWIELTHRVTSGLALILVLAVTWMALRRWRGPHPVRWWAVATAIFMVGEAAIGAGLVLFELVADNESMARALFMATHLGNTFLLLACQAMVLHHAEGGAPLVRHRRPALNRWSIAALVGAMLVGISGAIAALGDTLFPATSLLEALRQDLSATGHVLLQLRLLHPVIAVVTAVVILYLVSRVRASVETENRWASAVQALVLVQVAAGAINVVLLAPVWLQLVHLLLADLLWIALVRMVAEAMSMPGEDDGGPAS